MPSDVYLMLSGDMRLYYVGEECPPDGEDHDWYQTEYTRIMGSIRERSDLRTLLDGENEIVGVSNRSVMKGEGSAGYVILNKTTDQRVEASLLVDGAPEAMMSHRAELMGILAMCLVTQILINGNKAAQVRGT